LTNGTAYTIQLKTVTNFGISIASSSVIITPNTIITNGLKLYLDAGNTSSYDYNNTPNSWNNLISSASITNFSLINSPSFQTANGGYLFFNQNGTSAGQYGTTSQSLPLIYFTIDLWFYNIDINDGTGSCILTNIFTTQYINYGLGSPFGSSLDTNQVAGFFFNDGFYNTNRYTFSNSNTWYYITLSYDTSNNLDLYVNSQLQSSINYTKSIVTNNNGINLMKRWDGGHFWGGGLAIVRMYDRALTQSEINQNYSLEVGRF